MKLTDEQIQGIKDLLNEWDFESIAKESLEGYEQGVTLELLELVPKLLADRQAWKEEAEILQEQAKQLQLEKVIMESHAPEGRNYTNAQYVDLLMKYKLTENQLNQAVEILKKAADFIDGIMSFYGQNLMVFNWHLNGEGEPWDNFFDDNMDGDELELIQKFLSSLSQEEKCEHEFVNCKANEIVVNP